ncbi:MAG: polysaccharide biosynthesis/export family protein [Mariprofundaceae bacterium]|nr:polysaccharide biosynthesis/export family protein [Mariprofundaceae bacterium]
MNKFMIKVLTALACFFASVMLAGVANAEVGNYRLNAGDKINIHVFGESDMNVTVRLGQSGNIHYPFLGHIHVSGMTMTGLEKKITHDLKQGFLNAPQVRVSMEEFRPFYVNGEVANSGAYPYQPGLNIRKAIALSGGFSTDADEDKVFLIHAGDHDKKEIKVDLNAVVNPGDIITVKQSYFFVNGEVKLPGKYPYKAGMTYRMAIAIAGGLKERGDADKIYVIHEGKDAKSNHVSSIDAAVKHGDVIIIKQSFF